MPRGHSKDLNDTSQLISLVLASEQRVPSQKFGQDTAEAPHVNRHAVASADDYFWGTVEARLDVGVDTLVVIAARAKVNHLNTAGKK